MEKAICEAKIVRGWHSGQCDKKVRWNVRIVKGDMSFPWTVMDIGDNRKEVNFCGTHKNQIVRWEERFDEVVCEVKEIKKEKQCSK